MRDRDWVRLVACLLIFTMGILNILIPRKLLKKNLAPTGFKRLNGRQDPAAVQTVRRIGMVMVLGSIVCAAIYVWLICRI